MDQKKGNTIWLVQLGKEAIIRGQYDQACQLYNDALEEDPDHYLIRNALGEIYFIQKEFLSAADNFWLAAFDEASLLNFGLLNNHEIKNPQLLKRRHLAIDQTREIIVDYSYKIGLSLFAHQYENPLKKNTPQALINQYRSEIDPCGYLGYTDADPQILARVKNNVSMIGYRFLKRKTAETSDLSPVEPTLKILLDVVDIPFI